MNELKFYIKKLQDLPHSGDWKTIYAHSYEKIYPLIYESYFIRKNYYIKELERFNEQFLDLSFVQSHEERLQFRKIQKHIIDLLYQVLEETKKIFIIHGRDTSMTDKVATLLGKLKLDYTLLEYGTDEERVVKEFNKQAKECDYAIALFSADDLGRENVSFSYERFRTSQNVIFQLGYFLSHVGKKNIMILYAEDKEIESPVNFEGFAHAPFDRAGSWKQSLLKEMAKTSIYIHQELAERI